MRESIERVAKTRRRSRIRKPSKKVKCLGESHATLTSESSGTKTVPETFKTKSCKKRIERRSKASQNGCKRHYFGRGFRVGLALSVWCAPDECLDGCARNVGHRLGPLSNNAPCPSRDSKRTRPADCLLYWHYARRFNSLLEINEASKESTIKETSRALRYRNGTDF